MNEKREEVLMLHNIETWLKTYHKLYQDFADF